MTIQFIRNATIKIWYGGKCFLIDPYFAPKFSQPSFAGKSANPLIDLPQSVNDILTGVDYILISHLHPDHFDETARQLLPKNIPVFCQPPDEGTIRDAGFQHVQAIHESIYLNNIMIHRTDGRHGEGTIEKVLGVVSGFVFQHQHEKTLYWAGDTIWCEQVQEAIFDFSPEVIVCHAGGNRFFKENSIFGEAFQGDSAPVVMDIDQVIELCYFAIQSKVVATHIGALDHETVTRKDLAKISQKQGIPPSRLAIPVEGQFLYY